MKSWEDAASDLEGRRKVRLGSAATVGSALPGWRYLCSLRLAGCGLAFSNFAILIDNANRSAKVLAAALLAV